MQITVHVIHLIFRYLGKKEDFQRLKSLLNHNNHALGIDLMFISNPCICDSMDKQVTLSEKDIAMLIEILKFAEGACPVESINQEFAIDAEKIENLLSKLEKV
jgi:hypothetical protein